MEINKKKKLVIAEKKSHATFGKSLVKEGAISEIKKQEIIQEGFETSIKS